MSFRQSERGAFSKNEDSISPLVAPREIIALNERPRRGILLHGYTLVELRQELR